LSLTDTASRNVLIFTLQELPGIKSMKLTVRPSGTEPKVKMYFEVFGKPSSLEEIHTEKQRIISIRERLEKAFMYHCYELLGVEFPERGFLVFWQLPLTDKLKYFDIEDQIAGLRTIPDLKERQIQLDIMLAFLGANPVEKIDEAFKAKYKVGISEYLGLDKS
jgi:phosphoglucomutase/phosphomannomutase